jgi:hypothetical protein
MEGRVVVVGLGWNKMEKRKIGVVKASNKKMIVSTLLWGK